MSTHESGRPAAAIPLQTHLKKLRSRCEAAARFQGGHTGYHEELGIFREYASEANLYLPEPPAELNAPPDEEGNEHQVWYFPASDCYIKATWPDFFGMLVIHRPGEEPKASPIAYLDRWRLHNEIFGDAVEFLGALGTTQGLRMLIRQTAIAGTPATDMQIRAFFDESGWAPFEVGGHTAFFDPERNLVVSDTHRGNFVMMADGLLAPIDLRIQEIEGSLLDAVRKLCGM